MAYKRRRRAKKPSKYTSSLKRTRAMRSKVSKPLRPLFDHIVNLAKDAHAQSKEPGRGYLAKRAGIDLLAARRLANK